MLLSLREIKQNIDRKEVQLIKRNDVLSHLWEEADFFSGRSLDVFVSRLRKYFSEDPSIQIESVRGVGFRFLV